MSNATETLATGLGIVCGLIGALFLILLWISFAGAFQEWLCEMTLDRWRGANRLVLERQPRVDGLYSVLISDIHLDTWTFPENDNEPDPQHPKRIAFAQFTSWLKAESRIKDIYLNGDLMDFPPHPLNQPPTPILRIQDGNPNVYPDQVAIPFLGALSPLNEQVLLEIAQLDRRDPGFPTLRLTYVTGNHDLGLYGLRFIQPELSWSSVRVAWNPSLLLQMNNNRRLYMEHGHMHDPFIWLYLRYALMELIQGPEAAAQREGKVGMSVNRHIRSLPMDLTDEKKDFEGSGSVPLNLDEGIAATLARLRFRQAARRIFRTVALDEREKIRFLSMGHTHLPDRYIFPNGRTYINSGDWAGNDTNCTFVLIHPNGDVTGPHQWRPGTTLEGLVA